MTAVLLPNGKQQYFTTAGLPAVGYKVATFAAGTSTPQVTWQDALKVAQNANPIILDGRGEASIFWDGAYKVQLQDSTGAIIWTQDNLQSQPGFSAALVPATTNSVDIGSTALTWRNGYFGTNLFVGPNLLPVLDAAGNIGYYARTAQEIAAGVTPTNFSYPDGNVLRYGADITGVADSTYAFQQACFSTYAGWNAVSPTLQTRVVTIPGGRYKFSGVNTAYGTPTVFVRAGMCLTGVGQGTLLDLSAWGASAANVFQLGWGYIAAVATQDPGGQPPEMQNCFILGGPSGGGAAVAMWFNGGFVHDIWFSASGLAINLRGGYVYDCEIDIGLVGITIQGGTNQSVINCRFFNQNTAINFDASIGDFSDIILTGLTIEYPKITGVSFGANAHLIKGVKFVGCDFVNNPGAGVTSFSSCVSIALANLQVEFDHCTFHNWGTFALAAPAYAVIVQAAGAIVDLKGCLFDGAVTNGTYSLSTNASVLQLNQGTVNMTDCVIRNLPATYGQGILLGGSTANTLRIDGLMYSGGVQGVFAISAISKAASAVVTSSNAVTVQPFQVGSYMAFSGIVGMVEMNGAFGLITAVGGSTGAWTATVAINSTAFTVYTSGGSALFSLPLISITNSNIATQLFISNVKGDQLQPLLNPQSTVSIRARGLTDWFGPIAVLSTFNYVLLPFQNANLYQFALLANQNNAGSGAYRKSRLDFIEKDNDFAASAKSFLVQATAVQGAANTNPVMTLVAEFNQPGGTATVASVNSGCIAVSWLNTYSFVTVDAQLLVSG